MYYRWMLEVKCYLNSIATIKIKGNTTTTTLQEFEQSDNKQASNVSI